MTKQTLVKELAEKAGVSPATAHQMIKAFTEILAESLERGERTTLHGLGTFSLQEIAPTRIRNIKTGEPMEINARKRVRFKTSDTLAKRIAK